MLVDKDEFKGGGRSLRWRHGIQGAVSGINFNDASARIYAYEVAYTACSSDDDDAGIIFEQTPPSLTVSPGTL